MDHLIEIGRLGTLRDPLSRLGTIEADLTPPQLHAVAWVNLDGPLPMATIAQRVGCSGPTATGVVDRLEQVNLVRRIRKEGDRRVVLVEITDAGREVAEAVDDAVEEHLTMLLSMLEHKDRTAFVGAFQKIVDAMHAIGDEEDVE
jgi:DNA-binding MarR family transcriptional regulator